MGEWGFATAAFNATARTTAIALLPPAAKPFRTSVTSGWEIGTFGTTFTTSPCETVGLLFPLSGSGARRSERLDVASKPAVQRVTR